MKAKTAHAHTYDLHPNPKYSTMVACTVCGFAVPLRMLTSRVSLDAIVARENATQAVRDAVEGLR